MTQVLTVIMVSHLFLNLKIYAMRQHSSFSDETFSIESDVGTSERIYLGPITVDTTLDIPIAHE
jgi:hypothetical protein